MQDEQQTKAELLQELEILRRRVSELETANQQIQAIEQKYKDLINSLNEVVYTMDAEGNLISVSQAVKNSLGYEPEELIGRNCIDFISQEAAADATVKFKQLFGGERISAETIVMNKDKRPCNVEISAIPIMSDGKVTGARGVLRDITERKNAEELLRTSERKFKDLTETTTDWIWEVD